MRRPALPWPQTTNRSNWSKGTEVRKLRAGGKEIRTVGPAVKEKPFRPATDRSFTHLICRWKVATAIGVCRFAPDSPLEEEDSNLYGAFPVKRLFLVCWQFFVRSWKAVLRPVACDQVCGARGRGQGTETVAKLGGLPPSVACVSQRLDA